MIVQMSELWTFDCVEKTFSAEIWSGELLVGDWVGFGAGWWLDGELSSLSDSTSSSSSYSLTRSGRHSQNQHYLPPRWITYAETFHSLELLFCFSTSSWWAFMKLFLNENDATKKFRGFPNWTISKRQWKMRHRKQPGSKLVIWGLWKIY